MIYAQWILVVLSVLQFFRLLYQDINGRPAKEPQGFSGVVTTILSMVISFLLYYYSGAFSLIL